MGVRFSTVLAAVTRSLREEIVSGHRLPGRRLVVEQLAARFQVSPMPVREALRQLEAEGLVIIHSYRGATVAELSIEEIREIFLMRRLLEGEAARRGAQRMSEESLRRLGALMWKMRDTVDVPSRWIRLDRAFHMTLYRASGYPRLVRLIAQLRSDIERYVRLYITLRHNIPRSMRRHRQILAACAQRASASAQRLTRVHPEETAAMFIKELGHTTTRQPRSYRPAVRSGPGVRRRS